jgi:hypothetical protein
MPLAPVNKPLCEPPGGFQLPRDRVGETSRQTCGLSPAPLQRSWQVFFFLCAMLFEGGFFFLFVQELDMCPQTAVYVCSHATICV